MVKLIIMLASALPAIIGAILSFIGRKVGTAAGSLATFALLTVAFIGCINLIFRSILAILVMPIWIGNAIGMFVPSTFALCVSAIWSAKSCRAMYDMARFKIKIINSAN